MFVSSSNILDLACRSLLLGPLALLWVAMVVRVIGLRSFSKMASFDFVATVATGSLLANAATATNWESYLQSSVAVTSILGTQALITALRRKCGRVTEILENTPIVLMRHGIYNEAALSATRVTKSDVRAKLREANALQTNEIEAVVLETTGDISVLHGRPPDDELFIGVRSGGQS